MTEAGQKAGLLPTERGLRGQKDGPTDIQTYPLISAADVSRLGHSSFTSSAISDLAGHFLVTLRDSK